MTNNNFELNLQLELMMMIKKIKKIVLLLLLLTILLSGCNLPGDSSFSVMPNNSKVEWISLDPNAPATPTPFLPIIDVIETPEPDNLVEDEELTEEITGIPTTTKPKRPDGQINILILGSDFRPGSGYRTDVFMLLSLYPNEGTASVLSFPRDLYVNLPGIGNQRINVAQPFGGFELSKATLEQNFDVTADYYIMTSMQGFTGIVNNLGGITVNVGAYLSDTCHLPQAGPGKYCTVYAGPTYMNGDTALWYVRSRYTTSDFDRTRRAQEVMIAIFEKLMALDAISKVPDLYDLYISSVETNLTLSDIVPLVPIATKILNDPSKLRRFAIGPEQAYPYVLPDSGANVLIPNYELIQEVILESAFKP
ncbi:MAG TPA: LCP family protein [Anaerolineaceae bacterium]|nr:LCP family protein [Anaerolineaceae bacterium]